MNHDRTVLFAIRAGILRLKPQGELEIQLNRSTLPSPAQGIFQVEIDLRPVESPVALIDTVGHPKLIKSFFQAVSRHLPVLVASNAVVGAG